MDGWGGGGLLDGDEGGVLNRGGEGGGFLDRGGEGVLYGGGGGGGGGGEDFSGRDGGVLDGEPGDFLDGVDFLN